MQISVMHSDRDCTFENPKSKFDDDDRCIPEGKLYHRLLSVLMLLKDKELPFLFLLLQDFCYCYSMVLDYLFMRSAFWNDTEH